MIEIFNHESLIRKRLAARFDGAELTREYISSLLSGSHELETVFYDINSIKNIDRASGHSLSMIGEIVGAERDKISGLVGHYATDEELRLYIKSAISRNWSDHSIDSVINSIMYIINVDSVTVTEQGGAVVLIEFNRPLTPAEQVVLVDLGMIPKPAGVRYTYVVPTTDVPFGFDGTTNTLGFGDENIPGSGGTFLSEL